MEIWMVGISNQLFMKGTYTAIRFSNKGSYWQNFIFCDRSIFHFPFYLSQTWVLKGKLFYQNTAFSIFLHSTIKQHASFFKTVVVRKCLI